MRERGGRDSGSGRERVCRTTMEWERKRASERAIERNSERMRKWERNE
jgi:hypothetical protein